MVEFVRVLTVIVNAQNGWTELTTTRPAHRHCVRDERTCLSPGLSVKTA